MKVRRNTPMQSHDPARIGRATGVTDRAQVELARVGYTTDETDWPEETPAWIRWEQGEPLVEVQTRTGDKITARIGTPSLEGLSFGQQVVLVYPDGDPELAVIVATLCDSRFPEPSSVCGIDTGAADAIDQGTMIPAATWSFTRLPDGRALAIQTQGADILIWAGGSLHFRSSTSNSAGAPDGAIHLDGRVALGVPPLAAPTGSEVAPGGEELPGVAAVPYEPLPYTPPEPVPPNTVTPYQGNADGIVRARDMTMSSATIDPAFWANYAGIDAVARVISPALPPLPISMHSAISGVGGPGSKHTATGDSTPV
jgi:hypothetical protein